MSSLSQRVRAEVRDYLAAHPGAADSAEGIREWWLPETLRYVPLVVLRQVLERMVRYGQLRVLRLPDGQDLYASPDPGPGTSASTG